ncbi:MAG: hypothetical protein ACR2JY_04125 [Chloroflexota bacterium]
MRSDLSKRGSETVFQDIAIQQDFFDELASDPQPFLNRFGRHEEPTDEI